ncbi:MAG: tyrosine-type recombinase/integrase [Luteolibacter sp.]
MVAGRKLALTTERSYSTWIRQFLHFMTTSEARHFTKSEEKIEVFLSRMAREDYSSVSQNQAFNAILFLYRNVLKIELKDINALRCKQMKRERYTPTVEEVLAMLHELRSTPTYNVRLAGALMYACGMRVSECCQVRIKDFDLVRMVLTIWEGKGDKDRRVRIPEILVPGIRRQIARATALANMDIEARQPVQLPGRMDKSTPARQFDVEWHFLFPSAHPCAHPRTGKMVRWCVSPDVLQNGVKAAGKRAGITSRLTPHCLRHAFCSHLLDAGENIKRVGEAMGHSDIRTTAGYGRKECEAMPSPLDRIIIPIRKTA